MVSLKDNSNMFEKRLNRDFDNWSWMRLQLECFLMKYLSGDHSTQLFPTI